MNYEKFFKIQKTAPKALKIALVLFALSGVEDFVTGTIKDYQAFDFFLTAVSYISIWLLFKGDGKLRVIFIVISGLLAIGNLSSDDETVFFLVLHKLESIIYAYSCYLLSTKKIKEHFGVLETPHELKKVFPFIKQCTVCSTKIGVKNSFLLMRGKEFECLKCHSFLRQARKVDNTFLMIVSIELTFVPLGLIPLLLFKNEFIAVMVLFIIMGFGIYVWLKRIDVINFQLPSAKYLNEWVRGNEPGKGLSEFGKTIVLKNTIEESFIKCKEALIDFGAEFQWEDKKNGILRGRLPIKRNDIQDLILFNFETVSEGTKVDIFARNKNIRARDIFSKYEFIVENLVKALTAQPFEKIPKKLNSLDIYMVFSLIGALVVLSYSVSFKINGVNVFESFYYILDTFLYSFAIYTLIFFIFKNKLNVLFWSFHSFPGAKTPNKNDHIKSLYMFFFFMPILALIYSVVFLGNTFFDNSNAEVRIGYLGKIRKFDSDEKKDFCFDVFEDRKFEKQITEKRYCASEGYNSLRRGDKVEILTKKGFFYLPWAIKFDVSKYKDLNSLITESGGVERIMRGDIFKTTLSGNELILDKWKVACNKGDLAYCRSEAFVRGKLNSADEESDILRKLCSLQDNQSCLSLYSRNLLSKDEFFDFEKRVHQLCDLKTPSGCYYFGNILWKQSNYLDFKKAKPYLEIACKGDVLNSCTDLDVIKIETELLNEL